MLPTVFPQFPACGRGPLRIFGCEWRRSIIPPSLRRECRRTMEGSLAMAGNQGENVVDAHHKGKVWRYSFGLIVGIEISWNKPIKACSNQLGIFWNLMCQDQMALPDSMFGRTGTNIFQSNLTSQQMAGPTSPTVTLVERGCASKTRKHEMYWDVYLNYWIGSLSYLILPYRSKHCPRKYLVLNLLNHTPSTSWKGTAGSIVP